jgi:predicted amidohydrolase YtcJ
MNVERSLMRIIGLTLWMGILISCGLEQNTTTADTIILNAKVYTLSWDDPSLEGIPADNAPFKDGTWSFDAEAIAIKNHRIWKVGSKNEIQSYLGKATQTIDANGAVVIPGLIESHGHLQELGEKKEAIKLQGLDKQEIVNLMIQRSKEVPKGEWIIASGWDEAEFANDYPDMQYLCENTSDHPIVLIGLRGFGAMGNQLAFEKAGITSETQAKDGG